MKWLGVTLTGFILAAASVWTQQSAIVCGPISTDKGAVSGSPAGIGCSFKGIPYAQPPVGALRLRPPVPHESWTGVLDATRYGSRCAQLAGFTGGTEVPVNTTVTGNEDCLMLNIWAPPAGPGRLLPVMVWFHGGGHISGNSMTGQGGLIPFDGQYYLQQHGVMVVTVEYRLNGLGYLAHPALDAESDRGVSGNYGFLDQVAALQWLQRNIMAFGGDPRRVTIVGWSAGGQDVALHLVSPLSTRLFAGAILQSPAGSLDAVPTLAQAEQTTGAQVVAATGCAGARDVAACLRSLPFADLVRAVPGISPVIDRYAVLAPPLQTIAYRSYNHVPVILGTTADEEYLFVPLGSIPDDATYRRSLVQAFGESGGRLVLAQYPSSSYPSPERTFITAMTDHTFTCPVRSLARALAASQSHPVFRYQVTHAWGEGTPQSRLHSYHGQDLLFVWHTFAILAPYVPTDAERALADAVAAYWAQFVISGNPNSATAVAWPAYFLSLKGTPIDRDLKLDDQITPGIGIRTSNCNFWDTHPGQ